MSGFNKMWSQRSKVAIGRLEQRKIYPHLVTDYLLLWTKLFIDKQIS